MARPSIRHSDPVSTSTIFPSTPPQGDGRSVELGLEGHRSFAKTLPEDHEAFLGSRPTHDGCLTHLVELSEGKSDAAGPIWNPQNALLGGATVVGLATDGKEEVAVLLQVVVAVRVSLV